MKYNSWQKKWSGHGRTGRTADYGLAAITIIITVVLPLEAFGWMSHHELKNSLVSKQFVCV